MLQSHEVVGHTNGNEDPEDDEKPTLLGEIGFAGLPDEVGDLQHGLVCRQLACLLVLDNRKDQSYDADEKAEIHDGQTIYTAKCAKPDLAEIGQYDIRFTGKNWRAEKCQDKRQEQNG